MLDPEVLEYQVNTLKTSRDNLSDADVYPASYSVPAENSERYLRLRIQDSSR